VEDRLPQSAAQASRSVTGIPSRTYVGVGVSKNGRTGGVSKRVAVPLVPPPPAPATVSVTYTERAVTVSWTAPAVPPADGSDRPEPSVAYHVYDVTQRPGRPSVPSSQLTKTAITETTFSDERMTWGEARCYAVRTVLGYDALSIESDEARPPCV